MRTYETINVFKPQLSDNEVAENITTVKDLIVKSGGEMVSEENMGRRRLFHAMKHEKDGFYSYLKFKASPEVLPTLRNFFKLNENVMRSAIYVSEERIMRVKQKKVRKEEVKA